MWLCGIWRDLARSEEGLLHTLAGDVQQVVHLIKHRQRDTTLFDTFCVGGNTVESEP